MRFSREVMQTEISELGPQRAGRDSTRSSHFAMFLCTYLISTTLSIDPLSVAVLIKAPDDGSSGAAKALFAGHN